MNLYEIVKEKKHLEEQLEDCDTYTEELERIWRDNEIELKAKIDSYGYVLDDISNRKEYLKSKISKMKDIINSLEKAEEKLKSNLHAYSDGIKLEGKEYKFSPYFSERREVDMNLVEPKEKKYIVTMDYNWFTQFEAIANIDYNEAEYTYTTKCNVTDLPKEHPAIITKVTPSVRIIKPRSKNV